MSYTPTAKQNSSLTCLKLFYEAKHKPHCSLTQKSSMFIKAVLVSQSVKVSVSFILVLEKKSRESVYTLQQISVLAP